MSGRPDLALVLCPTWSSDYPPLGLAYLSAAAQKAGFGVRTFDFNAEFYAEVRRDQPSLIGLWADDSWKIWSDWEFFPLLYPDHFPVRTALTDDQRRLLHERASQWAERILRERPAVAGFSVMANTTLMSLLTARAIKERAPDQPIIFGGPNCAPGTNELFFLITGYVDGVATGEGEAALVRWLEVFQKDGRLSAAPGTMIRQGSEIAAGGPVDLCEPLDRLPAPDFASFRPENYPRGYKELPAMTSRGCIARCRYCIDHRFWGRMRFRSPASLHAELRGHYAAFGAQWFIFNDLVINARPDLLLEFSRLNRQQAPLLHWGGQFRGQPLFKAGQLRELHENGMHWVSFGLEHAAPRILELMAKGCTVESYDRALDAVAEAGLYASICVIVGYPGETEEDFQLLLDFIGRHQAHLQEVHASALHLIPGTALYEGRQELGIILPPRLELPPEMAWAAAYAYPAISEWRAGDNTHELRQERIRRLKEYCRAVGIRDTAHGAVRDDLYKAPGPA